MSADRTEGYDYEGLTSDPVPGIPPGSVLPLEQLPEPLHCPWCPDKPTFKSVSGLRGHAHGKHGIRWEVPKPVAKPDRSDWIVPEEREVLKPWMQIAITMQELYGLTYAEVAKRIDKSEDTLRRVGRSPAAKRLRVQVNEMFDEPEKIALFLMRANSINVTADFLAALEWAKDARDYAAVHKMTKDLLSMMGAEEKQQRKDGLDEVRELHIHLDSSDLAAPFVTSTHEVLQAEIVEDNEK